MGYRHSSGPAGPQFAPEMPVNAVMRWSHDAGLIPEGWHPFEPEDAEEIAKVPDEYYVDKPPPESKFFRIIKVY